MSRAPRRAVKPAMVAAPPVPRSAAEIIKSRNAAVFVDVSALMETSWTGIANVTANLARELVRKLPNNCYFFARGVVIDPVALLTAIDNAPGAYLEVLLANGYAQLGAIGDFIGLAPVSVGIFPNIKTAHRVFDVEAVVLHDLSAMLMPELHQDWAAHEHSRAMLRDVHSSEVVCCVSAATQADALAYLGLDPKNAIVSHLGVRPPPAAQELPRENFAIVLGTIEPRKNLRLVAEFMLSRPDLARKIAMVFVGRRGWGPAFDEVFGELLTHSPWKDSICFTDFIGEAEKWALMRSARFAIFPSLFEGFGLPVVECMAAGCPVIASRSSSIVEFGLPEPMYFDPFSLTDFTRAFRHIETMPAPAHAALAESLRVRAGEFTWDAFCGRLLNAVAARLPAASGS
ncbi:glycosyltransferase family 1 protein [Acidocella sp.]|uniref:glycosyltransferase family 4 protein n=1 Tax=Acidocella sp. TaxID=50710 RepID=UPI00261566FD|nr:glycosyltransferase family 1 protein [Acidocella sp.]